MKSRAAELIGMPLRTFQLRVDEYQLAPKRPPARKKSGEAGPL